MSIFGKHLDGVFLKWFKMKIDSFVSTFRFISSYFKFSFVPTINIRIVSKTPQILEKLENTPILLF